MREDGLLRISLMEMLGMANTTTTTTTTTTTKNNNNGTGDTLNMSATVYLYADVPQRGRLFQVSETNVRSFEIQRNNTLVMNR
jgi:hypothetical protein